MPDSDGSTYSKLGYEVDQASIAQIIKYIGDVEQRFAGLERATAKVGQTADRTGRELIDAVRKSRTEIEEASQAADKLGDSLSKAQQKGKFDLSRLGSLGSAASQLGFTEVGGAIQKVGVIGQIGKELEIAAGGLASIGISATGLIAIALPLAAAIGTVTIATAAYKKELEKINAPLLALVNDQDEYYKLVVSGTRQELQAAIENKRQTNRINQAIIDENKGILKQARDEFLQQNAGQNARPEQREAQFNAFVGANPALAAAKQKIDDLKKAIEANNVVVERYEGAYKNNLTFATDARLALEKFGDTLEKLPEKAQSALEKLADVGLKIQQKQANDTINDIKAHFAEEDDIRAFAAKASSKDLEERLADDARRVRQNRQVIISLEGRDDPTGKFAEQIKALTEENERLYESDLKLVNIATPLIELREKEADLAARDARLITVQQKHNTDVQQIEERSLERRADIQKAFNEKLVDIARQGAEAAAQQARELQRQKDDLATSFARDGEKITRDAAASELDIRIKAARDDAQATREHAREVQQIKDDAAARETTFLLDRNFRGLLESRLQTSADIGKSTTRFSQQQQEKQIAEQHELSDLQRSIANQRKERQIAYQQQVADANLANRRALEDQSRRDVEALRLANEAHAAELRDLATKTRRELDIKRAAYDAELKMANAYGVERGKLQQRIDAALVDQARRELASMTARGGSSAHELTRRAGGGDVFPGDIVLVNDRSRSQRESVGGMQFMGGQGIYLPLKQGYVDPGNSGGDKISVQITQQITSAAPDARGLARDLKPHMEQAAVDVVKRIVRR